jgi:hypothetical protein
LRLIRFSFPVNPVLPVVCWEILFLNLYSRTPEAEVQKMLAPNLSCASMC